MCGIAGAASLFPGVRPDPGRVREMMRRIAHRGPDGDGLVTLDDGRVVLGHRRLAVIDLVSGQQPMCSADGESAITFNGEIYNYRELRAGMLREGVTFTTDSDTEVLLRLYQRLGTACLDALRGMFAFAIWDFRRHALTLARDRLGKKPLYWVVEGDCLYFCSALQPLRDTATTRWQVDLEAVDSFLALGYIPAPRTIYRQARKLEAATCLVMTRGQVEISRYWDLARDAAPFEGGFAEALDRLDALVREAVALRLRSDVPLGVLLSGGVDSSLVAAVASEVSDSPVQTFCIGFDESGYDESPFAAQVAEAIGTEHRTFHVRAETLDDLRGHIGQFGEPFADASFLPLWALARETRKHVTVALGGDGGDEGFAGYNWYRTALQLRRIQRFAPAGLIRLGGRVMDAGVTRWRRIDRPTTRVERLREVFGDDDAGSRFARLRQIYGTTERERLSDGELRESLRDRKPGVAGDLRALYDDCAGTALRRMRYVDIRTYLADRLMTKADVSTMAFALELRAPLLDHTLLEFALALPDAMVLDGARTKLLLRALADRYLPSGILERPKQGFTPPVSEWFRSTHLDAVRRLVHSERFADRRWFKPGYVDGLVAEHLAGGRDNGERLFSLLVLDEWLKDNG